MFVPSCDPYRLRQNVQWTLLGAKDRVSSERAFEGTEWVAARDQKDQWAVFSQGYGVLYSNRLPELDCRYAGGSGVGLPAPDLQEPHGGEGKYQMIQQGAAS